MSLIQNLHFFCLLTFAFMACYILYKDPKALLNRVCAVLIGIFSLWNFTDVFSFIENTPFESANLYQNISAVAWISFASFLLAFSLVFSNNKKLLSKKWFLAFIIVIPLSIIIGQVKWGILGQAQKGIFGWELAWNQNIWTYLFFIYYSSFTLYAIYNIYLHKRKTQISREKSQARIMIVTLIISLIGGTVTDVIMPMLQIQVIPQIANVVILFFAGGMIYAIVKYRFLVVTPAIAAENIISTMNELLILLDNKGLIRNVNNSVIHTLKYEEPELNGKFVELLFIKDQLKNGLLERIILGENIKNHETLLRSKDQKEIPVILSCSPLKDKEDNINGIVFVARDLTELKRSEEIQKISEGLVRTKLNTILMPDGDIGNLDLADIIDVKRIQELMNHFYGLTKMGVAIINTKGEVLVSTGWQDICTKFHRKHPSTLENCMESDTMLTKEVTNGSFKVYKCKNNMWDISTPIIVGQKHVGNLFLGQFLYEDEVPDYELFRKQAQLYGFDEKEYISALERVPKWSHETINTTMSFYAEMVNIISILSYSNIKLAQTLAAQKRIELDLEQAKVKAEDSDRSKSTFLANMSHEIRTPMNGILGFAEQLKDTTLTSDTQQEYIRIIETSGKRMLNIINDIISISKIEAGQIEVSVSETNINDQIKFLYNFFKPEVEKIGLSIFYKTNLPNSIALINTDREKVYAILTNLIKNAIKFTEIGSIEFGYNVNSTTKNGQPAELEFFVKDSGSGIRPEQKNIIFERFRQSNDNYTRNNEGAGLGLSISKAYAEMLGGKIWVESEFGKGSTFYFTIPDATINNELIEINNAEPENETENEQGDQIKDLKILIVDDDETSEMLITLIVEKICKEVIKVRSGHDAVETCRTHPDIDFVLMDIQMSEMNGYEAMQKIRQFNKEMKIIAQTAYALMGERERAIDAGFNDYISKPILKSELLALIKDHLN